AKSSAASSASPNDKIKVLAAGRSRSWVVFTAVSFDGGQHCVLQGATMTGSKLHRTAHRWSRPSTRRLLQYSPEVGMILRRKIAKQRNTHKCFYNRFATEGHLRLEFPH